MAGSSSQPATAIAPQSVFQDEVTLSTCTQTPTFIVLNVVFINRWLTIYDSPTTPTVQCGGLQDVLVTIRYTETYASLKIGPTAV